MRCLLRLIAVQCPPSCKVEVDLVNDVEEPAQATILEGLIEEYEDRIVVPFQLSAPGRLSFMLTNITLPTELDVLVGSTGRPSIQGFQVANGRDSVPEPGSTSLRSPLDITGCPGQGEIFPGSPYYLFYVTTDMNNLRRSSLQQLTTLRSARTTARIAPSTSQPP